MSEIDRSWRERWPTLAEHYERAMTRQAEQLAELGGRLQRQVNDLARDYAAETDAVQKRFSDADRFTAALASTPSPTCRRGHSPTPLAAVEKLKPGPAPKGPPVSSQ